MAAEGDGLELGEDLGFQRRAWRVQRIGWVVIALFVVAAILGVLGSGPLSSTAASAAGAFDLEYERFTRYQDASILTLRLLPGVTAGDHVRVAVSRAYLDHAEIRSIVPPPVVTEAADGRVIYTFRVAEPGRPLIVSYTVRPEHIGPVRAAVRLETSGLPAHEVRFWQFTYP